MFRRKSSYLPKFFIVVWLFVLYIIYSSSSVLLKNEKCHLWVVSCCSFVALAQNLGRFDRYTESKSKIMSLEVDSPYQTECSMEAICNGYGLLCFHLTKNVSCEYDRWVFETQLCKHRDASDTPIGRVCAIFYSICNTGTSMAFVNWIYDTSYGCWYSVPLVLLWYVVRACSMPYVILMKDIDRSVTPLGATRQGQRDDFPWRFRSIPILHTDTI